MSREARRIPRRLKPLELQDHRLSRADVMTRIKNHGPNHYAGLYNVMKGVTLAGAGVALARLANAGFPPAHLVLIVVALVGIFLTYYGQSVGLIVVHLRPSILDVALPMTLTVLEFFIVYRPGTPPQGDIPSDWFGGLAVWALLAASVVASVAWRLAPSNYSTSLWPTLKDYRSRLYGDVVAATALAAGTLAFAAARPTIQLGTPADYVFLAVVAVVLGMGVRSQGRARRMLSARLGAPV